MTFAVEPTEEDWEELREATRPVLLPAARRLWEGWIAEGRLTVVEEDGRRRWSFAPADTDKEAVVHELL